MTLTRRFGLLAAAGLLAAPTIGRAQMRTLADTMAGDTRFSRFLDIITRGTFVEDFRQASPMTVFAPVDQAFMGAPAGLMQDLLGNNESGNNTAGAERERLGALIKYHMVPGMFSAEQLSGGERRIRTVNGGDLLISGSGTSMTVRNPAPAQQLGSFGAAGAQVSASPAQVLGSPTMASNGVIYPISQILWP